MTLTTISSRNDKSNLLFLFSCIIFLIIIFNYNSRKNPSYKFIFKYNNDKALSFNYDKAMNSVSIGIPLSDTIFSIEFLHFRSSHLYRETIKFLLSDDRFKNLPFCLAGTGDLDISGILFLDCDLDFFSGELLQLFKPYLSNYVLLDFEQCSIYSRFSCNFIDKSLNVDFYMCDFFINNLGGLLPCYIEKLDIRHSNFKNNRVYFTENIGLQRLRIINTDLRVLPIGLSKMLDLKLLAISYNNIIDTIDLCVQLVFMHNDLSLLNLEKS